MISKDSFDINIDSPPLGSITPQNGSTERRESGKFIVQRCDIPEESISP